MLDEITLSQGQEKVTIPQFNRFFAEYDINTDGYISKNECAKFVKKFLGNPQTVQDKASNMMRDIELEKQRKLEDMALLRQNRNQVRGPSSMYTAPTTFDEFEQP